MKRFLKLLMVMILVLSLCACGKERPANDSHNDSIETTTPVQNTEPSSPLLYQVTDSQGHTIWLFGTIHVGRESFYPLPEYVMDAYYSADALAVEFDVVAYQNDMSAMMEDLQLMIYTDGTTIKDHISPQVYETSVQILTENGMYNTLLDYYCPAMWSQTIDAFTMEKLGIDTNLGIDVHLLNLAHDEGKQIVDIESADIQYGMLASFSDELQSMLLKNSNLNYALPSIYSVSLNAMMDAWESGDEATLVELALAQPELTAEEASIYAEYTDALITQRNIRMADFAEAALNEGRTLLICVGAAHVVGEGGIADLLADRGYTVQICQ